ncbi:MAG: cytochrome c [Archangium sp.]|nr:cytochrome c [Archangium sp.]
MKKLWPFAGLLMACAAAPLPREQLTEPGALMFNGYVRADVDCYRCHGGDGTTGRAPNLSRAVPRMSDQAVADIIRNGEDQMPAFGNKLSADDLEQLVAWLRGKFPAKQ